MLILFDIDGTLIRTHGAGMRALEDAGRDVVGPGFSAVGVDFAGSLDPVILGRMLERVGVEASGERIAAIRARYPGHLRRRLEEGARRASEGGTEGGFGALPGVVELLDRLRQERSEWTLGLLTGNFEEGARLKLEACGIGHDGFAVRVYGDDSAVVPARREHLPPVAMERFERLTGRRVGWGRVLIIGDTAHDVACARAHGARSLAVTTGGHSGAQLRASGADRVVETLEGADGLVKWMDEVFEQAGT